MEWKVINAYNVNTERQQLNAILKEIRSSVNSLSSNSSAPTTQNIKDTVGTMVSGNSERGLSVSYNVSKKVLDFAISSFMISLQGDINGSATYTGNGNVVIDTTIALDKLGVEEAPSDNQYYVRRNKEWNTGVVVADGNNIFTGANTFTEPPIVPDAVNPMDAVNLETLQSYLAKLDLREEVAYTSTSALAANTYSNGSSGVGATLTGNSNGPLVIDGITAITGFEGLRVLPAGESNAANNGIYTITQVGVVAVSPYILTRATDFDQAAEIGPGIVIPTRAPSALTPGTNDGTVYLSIAPVPFTVGTDAITFSAIGTAGSGDVVGPSSAVDGNVTLFDGTTGKLIKDGGTLGTAAFTDSTDYATAAQGATADSAVQPGDLATVATSGAAADVSIVDAGGYFTSTDVEGALQELGAGGGGGITALTGDVTASGTGSVAATIANSAVTLAKQADVATGTVFYRTTAGTGAPEVQTLATLKTDLAYTKSDVGLGSVTNDAQTQAAIVPNTAPTAGQILVGNAGGTAYAPVTMSGDATMTSAGVVTVTGGGGGGGYSEGTSFPGSPTTNQKFYRTDLNFLCYYDGTRWLTVEEYSIPGTQATVAPFPTASSGSQFAFFPARTDFATYLTRLTISTYVNGTNNSSNFWTFAFGRYTSTAVFTSILSFDTHLDTVNTMTDHSQVINAPLNAAGIYMGLIPTKTGTPGNVFPFVNLSSRLIVT